ERPVLGGRPQQAVDLVASGLERAHQILDQLLGIAAQPLLGAPVVPRLGERVAGDVGLVRNPEYDLTGVAASAGPVFRHRGPTSPLSRAIGMAASAMSAPRLPSTPPLRAAACSPS